MGRRSGLVVLAVVGAAAGATVASADLVIPASHPPGPNTLRAVDAVNDARGEVARGDRACRTRAPQGGGSVTHEPIPQDMLDAFAVLRRPETPQDAVDRRLRFPFADRIAVDYARRARVLPDGTRVLVIPALDAQPHLRLRPERCFARERAALEHRLRGEPPKAQRAARRLLRDAQRDERDAARRQPRAGLFVFTGGPHGGSGGGGQDVATIRKHGSFSSSYIHGRGSRVVGLIPDGVATIDFAFARGRSLEPEGKRKRVYRTVYRRTVAVVHNIVALTVPRLPMDALFYRQVWRATDGSVVNIVRAPGLRPG
jgi:hypothetical protein